MPLQKRCMRIWRHWQMAGRISARRPFARSVEWQKEIRRKFRMPGRRWEARAARMTGAGRRRAVWMTGQAGGSQTSGGRNETQDRLIFDGGYLSEDMVTEPDTQEAVLEDVYVLLVGRKINNIEELRYKFFGQIIPDNRKLLLVAKDYSRDAYEQLGRFVRQGFVHMVAVGGGRKRNLRGDSVPDRHQNHRCGTDQLCDT